MSSWNHRLSSSQDKQQSPQLSLPTPHLPSHKNMTPSIQPIRADPPASQFSLDSHVQENSQESALIQTQIESLTQMDCTQQSLPAFGEEEEDETPSSSFMTPLSPPAPVPWARLVPCVPSKDNPPVDLLVGKSEYWLGRSSAKCDITVRQGTSLSKKEQLMLGWAHSMISNQHCRIVNLSLSSSNSSAFQGGNNTNDNDEDAMDHEDSPDHDKTAPSHHRPQSSSSSSSNYGVSLVPTPPVVETQILLEDHSGNGTFVNQSVHLRKGNERILHSGDEICLVNPDAMRKRIPSSRRLRQVLQHYTYVLVLLNNNNNSNTRPRRACVNPRAMNYNGTQLGGGGSNLERGCASPRSARRIEAHYEIREVLGDGTSGQVRRAIHRQTGKEHAVKVISLRRQLDLTSMEQEVNMMQSLDHPYIVQLVDVFVHHGIAMYLVMELVAGGDLFDRIVQQERYSEVDARRVMRRLLSAVHYLHQTKNIVHRDLKPENILCSSPTHVKLADFGLAKIIQSDGLKTFCGTPQYFAPEVLQRRTTLAGSGRYGKPADMWSLGVILYILLTGRPPFEADLDPLQAFDSLDFDDPLWVIMPQAKEFVQQMLRLDPKRRITVRQACEHPWINTHDGDTHVHPLDDPAVTGRKRLFLEPQTTNPNVPNGSGTTTTIAAAAAAKPLDAASVASDGDSMVSKESILSKEDFAVAATSLQRAESVDFLNAHEKAILAQADDCDTTDGSAAASPSKILEEAAAEEQFQAMSRTSTVENEDEHGPKPRRHCPNKTAGDSDGDYPMETQKSTDSTNSRNNPTSPRTTSDDGNGNTMSTSPETTTTGLMPRELSVTPSECGGDDDDDDDDDLARSPLAAMSLNERSNRFRTQVLRQSQSRSDDATSPTHGRQPNAASSSPSHQVAVTPTASIVRPIPTSNDNNSNKSSGSVQSLKNLCPEHEDTDANANAHGLEVEEDPILSQFSSDPSSLQSFPDSPLKATADATTALQPSKAMTTSSKNDKKATKKGGKKRKRPVEAEDSNGMDSSDNPIKRGGNNSNSSDHNPPRQARQTTLSSWFVPAKKNKGCESK